ncbi:MAG: hypothetical protein WB421_13105 [Terriglobales bacterium]|jgi:hypothetical protein
MGFFRQIRNILPFKPRDLGAAFLLALCSWFVLTPIWTHSSPGGIVDRAIGGLFYAPYRLGKHLAHVAFPDHGPDRAIRNPTGYYIAPLMGIAGEILFLMALWLIGIRIVHWMWARKRHRDGTK